MYGAILDKYRAMGGPADSDLGFPTIDEGPGRISPESRNSTFSAADQPVIFWTPDTGAWVVRGAINAAWDRLGGSAGVLGVPIAEETYDGALMTQQFSAGQISFDTRTKTFTTEPPELTGQLGDLSIPGDASSAINAAYRAAGGTGGPLGARQGEQFAIEPDGAGQAFAGGTIFYSPATGAQALTGAILEKFDAAGGPTGDLGLPNAPESEGGVPGSRVSSFAAQDNPVIFSTGEHGAVIVRGAMKAAWDKLGGAAGALGVPVADQSAEGDKVTQKFGGGQLTWDAKSNSFTTDPANLAESLGGLEVPAQPSTEAPKAPNPPKDNAFAFHTWWLWWIIPLALLLIGSLFAFASARRRRGAIDLGGDREIDESRSRWTPVGDTDEPAYRSGRRQEPAAPVGTAVVPPPTRWETPDEAAVEPLVTEHGLFTHRGAHEAADDQDAVDTAPTRVHTAFDDEFGSGRHAAIDRPGWAPLPEDLYGPRQGSLFEPVGDIPSPAEDLPDEWDYLDDYGDDDIDGDGDGEARAVEAAVGEPDPAEDLSADPDDDPELNPVADDLYLEEEYQAEQAEPPAIHLPLEDPAEAPAGYPVKGSMSSGTYHTPDSSHYDEVTAEIWFADAQHAEANGFIRAD